MKTHTTKFNVPLSDLQQKMILLISNAPVIFQASLKDSNATSGIQVAKCSMSSIISKINFSMDVFHLTEANPFNNSFECIFFKKIS